VVRDREGERDSLRQAIRDNGGDRITALDREIASGRAAAEDRKRRAEDYRRPAERLGFAVPKSIDAFVVNAHRIKAGIAEAKDQEARVVNLLMEQVVAERDWRKGFD